MAVNFSAESSPRRFAIDFAPTSPPTFMFASVVVPNSDAAIRAKEYERARVLLALARATPRPGLAPMSRRTRSMRSRRPCRLPQKLGKSGRESWRTWIESIAPNRTTKVA